MFKITRSETTVADAINNRHQWAVEFTALYSADDSVAKIFVMQATTDPDVFADSLSCVANATQMTDLPEDAPAGGSPFYRINTFTKLCRSARAAEEFVDKVQDAVQDLANNLDSAANLTVVETVTITPEVL